MTAEQTKIAEESHVKAPWLNVYGVVPPHLDYPDCTMYEAVERCAETYPNHTAYVFMGRKTTYRAMAAEIDLCARALKATGVRPGDRITMAMPNCPQAVIIPAAEQENSNEGDSSYDESSDDVYGIPYGDEETYYAE